MLIVGWNILAGFSIVTCLVLSLATLISNSWVIGIDQNNIHEGIWQRCVSNICIKIEDSNSFKEGIPIWLMAVRGILCISVMFYMATLIFHLVASFLIASSKSNYFTATFTILSSVFMFISMALYTRKFEDSDFTWGWGFLIGWLCFILTLATFTIVFLYSRKYAKEMMRLLQAG